MRLINADKLRADVLDWENCYNGFSDTYDMARIIDAIDEQPTIDPVLRDKENGITYTPVRRWRWYQDDQDKILGRIRCSKCQWAFYSIQHYKYCPNCGARMRGEKDG